MTLTGAKEGLDLQVRREVLGALQCGDNEMNGEDRKPNSDNGVHRRT